jgi:hypothetical protein
LNFSILGVITSLQKLFDDWVAYKALRSNALRKLLVRPPVPRGVYLWGDVGRGKSFLMDSLFVTVPVIRKTRVHFHEFMRGVHAELHELSNMNRWTVARRGTAPSADLFDEFHVSDSLCDDLIPAARPAIHSHRLWSLPTTRPARAIPMAPVGACCLRSNVEHTWMSSGRQRRRYRRRAMERIDAYPPWEDAERTRPLRSISHEARTMTSAGDRGAHAARAPRRRYRLVRLRGAVRRTRRKTIPGDCGAVHAVVLCTADVGRHASEGAVHVAGRRCTTTGQLLLSAEAPAAEPSASALAGNSRARCPDWRNAVRSLESSPRCRV